MVKVINTEDFKKDIFDYVNKKEWEFQGELPTIIDFYADWCGPCKQVAPILDDLSEEYKDKVNFVKINVDENQEVAMAFQIQSIPSVLFIPIDDKPQMSIGALPKEGFVKGINDILLKVGSNDESPEQSSDESMPESQG